MAPQKRNATSASAYSPKKRRTKDAYSKKANTVKEMKRRDALLSKDPVAAERDLNRRNRNVASSRAVMKLKKTDEFKAMTLEAQKQAVDAEKARVKQE